MTMKPPVILVLAAASAIVALSVTGFASPAAAQVSPPPGGGGPSYSAPSARPRIEVNPRPLYRRCAARYVVQHRPSGTVLFPEKHCWWERG